MLKINYQFVKYTQKVVKILQPTLKRVSKQINEQTILTDFWIAFNSEINNRWINKWMHVILCNV